MTNIEKLYEMAKVEKKIMCDWTCYSSLVCNSDYKHFNSQSLNYPPFTDTKQLELIKWFLENIDFLELSHNGEEFEFYSNGSRTRDKDFSQALASFIYYKWDDLTDEQREEVRGILQ